MKSDLELAVEASKTLESLLVANFSATGRGLHEKLTSVASRLPERVVREARFIATVRNKIVHEHTTQAIENRARFLAVVQRLEQALSHPGTPGRSRRASRSAFRRFFFSEGRHQGKAAALGAAVGFLLTAAGGLGFPLSFLAAIVAGMLGYWWNRVLGVAIIALGLAAAAGALYWLYTFSRS